MEKRESLSSIHMSKWVDAIAKALTRNPGMVRLDFQPVSPVDCSKLIAEARKICDKIATYFETTVQAGDNISVDSKGDIIETIHNSVKANEKYDKSSSASVSWKGISSKLSDLKKEAEYFIQLFSGAKKQGWTVEMTVSADLGMGELSADERDGREKALSVPLAAMLTNAGYTCKWDNFGGYQAGKPHDAILLPAAYVTEFISFPTTSFFGFERVKNCYYNVNLPCDGLSSGKVVISLDSLADDADKSIVMGVIIAQYYEYLKTKCIGSTRKELQHIVVIEEAHHLFAGDAAASASSGEGGSGQNSTQEVVKTLNNMLAEIRAYGEGFIIVDQSLSALHPSVLKNTGIKVAHRIDYGQDIEAMQDVLLLDKDDRELATLCPGQALVHYGGMRTSAKVQVPSCNSKETSVIIEREEISGNSVVTPSWKMASCRPTSTL